MPPSPERPFLLNAKNSGSRYCCACLYFCLLMLLSVFIVACVSVVCIIWWSGKLFRLSLSLFLLVLLLSVFIVVFCHCFLLSSLSVLYDGQASYSGCLYYCTCLYFCLLLWFSFLFVSLLSFIIVVFYHRCLYYMMARQVIQVVWSCPTVPSKLPSRGLCPISEYYCRTTDDDKIETARWQIVRPFHLTQ